MIEINEYTPNPLAPVIFVNKIGGIYREGELIKCTFVLAAPTRGGIITTTERVSLLWTPGAVHEANEMFKWVFDNHKHGSFVNAMPDDGGGHFPVTQ